MISGVVTADREACRALVAGLPLGIFLILMPSSHYVPNTDAGTKCPARTSRAARPSQSSSTAA
jgi:hypothetical protein